MRYGSENLLTVDQEVAGSKPVGHPNSDSHKTAQGAGSPERATVSENATELGTSYSIVAPDRMCRPTLHLAALDCARETARRSCSPPRVGSLGAHARRYSWSR